MKRLTNALLFTALAWVVSAPALAAAEDEPSAMAMAGDMVVARPIGVAITAVGAAVFVASLPFTALGGNVSGAADTLVTKPAAETLARCGGCKSTRRPSDM